MDPAAFCASLVRIGFSVSAAAYIVALILGKAFCSLTLSTSPIKMFLHFVLLFVSPEAWLMIPMVVHLVDLADEDVSSICAALRCPGGMINDPNGCTGAPQIRNPGIPV
jgi:hypothetical protein